MIQRVPAVGSWTNGRVRLVRYDKGTNRLWPEEFAQWCVDKQQAALRLLNQ